MLRSSNGAGEMACSISASNFLRSLLRVLIEDRSFWTLTGSPRLVASVAKLAREKGCSAEEIVYRFAQSVGVTPLSGTTSEAHMRTDVAVEKIELEGEEVQVLRELIGYV